MTFTKVDRGWYATEDGTYAVVVDGYAPKKLRDPADVHLSVQARDDYGQGGEWALVHDPRGELRSAHNAGENLDWFPTKREAVAAAARFC